MVLAQEGLPVPTTVHLPRRMLNDSFADIAGRLGLPFVLKAMNASGGRLNFLIETEIDFLRYVENPALAKVAFLAQQFIPNNGTFRTLVFGGDVPIVMHRCNTDGSHLTNTEQGGHATLFDVETFEAEVLEMAAHATELMGCEIAGVNLVQHRQTRQWYLLEVNSSPAIGSGAFAEEKTRAYCSYLHTKLSGICG
jgi:glutathione synthase/RimK-type ligase-like ATP-grasp enzyme